MTDPFLDTKEFASLTGISNHAIAKYLREGRLKGEKKSGKWSIPRSELQSLVVTGLLNTLKEDPPPTVEPESELPDFSVSEFSLKTFLTETGVKQWLAKGLLQGKKNDRGEWRISAANLENPKVKRLVR
ncbi:MAG: helix-turn-helix domain-containing protein [Proteobacteria bacterium]|nr:helix-turn-helix domain-containing protein [Pseudomonadota bacterium]